MAGPLDELDRRIVSALHADGRASWHRIAEVIKEPERTVTRRGTRLLKCGFVKISGLPVRGRNTVVGVDCTPGQARMAASALARRQDSIFTCVLTGSPDCIAELVCPRERLGGFVMDELPGIPGMVRTFTLPVLRHIRTIREWQPGLLTEDEVAALVDSSSCPPQRVVDDGDDLPRADRLLLQAVAEDGRCTYEELARVTGLAEATARRRLDRLRSSGKVRIRAVVAPALLGLPVEAVLWVRTVPAHVETVAAALCESSCVRYASVVTGERQLVVKVALPTEDALYEFVTRGSWLRHVRSVETSMILDSLKRGGVLAPHMRD
jgi:DNA-binding Lrp family transcriptional regulator